MLNGCNKILFFIFLILTVTGCATIGFNTVEKTKQLSKGMSYQQVIQILGEPESSQRVGNKWILRYTLHENWKGSVPYVVEFDRNKKRLLSWYEDKKEYEKRQKQQMEIAKSIGLTQDSKGAKDIKGAPGGGSGGTTDSSLMKWFAGSYYSFSGSTERRLVLCANGYFRGAKESSYSHGAGKADAWGAASQSGSRGTWTIQGNQNQGTITLNFSSGGREALNYRAGSDRGCFYFTNVLYCYEGAGNCQ
jgi:outer membrane protein assembly factor BamE (lipoprotein component of BamABCDE complex)